MEISRWRSAEGAPPPAWNPPKMSHPSGVPERPRPRPGSEIWRDSKPVAAHLRRFANGLESSPNVAPRRGGGVSATPPGSEIGAGFETGGCAPLALATG